MRIERVRIESAGTRTWLLAALAGWAVIAWMLALVGMGGRIEPLEVDPSLLRPLPTMPAASVSRLGPPAQYSEIGARPLFAQDRTPRPFSLQGDAGEAGPTAFDYVLTSVLITPGLKLAILQPPDGSESVRVKLDEAPESHPAWRMITLGPRSAVFEGPEGQRELELRVYDGIGGPPPTAVAPVPRPRAPAGLPVQPPPPPKPQPTPARTDDAAASSAGSDAASPDAPAAPQPEAPTPSQTPMTDQSQMEAIRQRIQARREQLRQQNQNPSTPQPPAKSP